MGQKGFIDILLIPIISLTVLATLIYIFIFQPYQMSGNSMYPNLKNGEYFLVNKIDKNFQKGEIVVFKNPKDPNQDLVKRIEGVPDEKIDVNGQEVKVSSDEYFVLGDNRDFSLDSRNFGPIKKSSIIGKYWFNYSKP